MIEQIIYGIITGVAYSIAGWQKGVAKNKKVFNEVKYDWAKMIKSVLICGTIGAFAGYANADFNIIMTGSIGIAVTNLFNILWKILYGKFNKYIDSFTKNFKIIKR